MNGQFSCHWGSCIYSLSHRELFISEENKTGHYAFIQSNRYSADEDVNYFSKKPDCKTNTCKKTQRQSHTIKTDYDVVQNNQIYTKN